MTQADALRRAALMTMPERVVISADTATGLVPICLQLADQERIVELHERLFAQVPQGTFRHDTPDFFARILSGNGAILGLENGAGALVAYGVLNLPEPDESHYGRILGMPPETWPLVAQLEGIGVDASWQGLGLQKLLGRWRMAIAIEIGYRHICATASPRNAYSCKNLISLGLVIRGLHLLYGGCLRYVFHRNVLGNNQYPVDLEIDVADHARQRQLFAAGAIAHGWRDDQGRAVLLFALPGG